MNFVTLSFVAFFLTVLATSMLMRKGTTSYKAIFIAANLFFYGSSGIAFLPLLLGVAFMNWLCGHLMDVWKKKDELRRVTLILNIAIHIIILLFFKYYEFLILNLETLLATLGITNLPQLLPAKDFLYPAGLSFYTFQGLSYAIDHYRNPKTIPASFLQVLAFVSFFPTIMAGPIMRSKDFFAQWNVKNAPALSHEQINSELVEGFSLILSGLFKKVVIASYLSEHIVRETFLAPDLFSSTTLLIAAYAYSMQIYCDFSGYTDMALGIGRLMGYKLPENFRSPYLACNLQDFWRRWHITLSTWLKDYLYIPLGGNRKGSQIFNLILTMTLGGLWHGAHIRFLIWGFMHGFGLAINHLWSNFKKKIIPVYAPHVDLFAQKGARKNKQKKHIEVQKKKSPLLMLYSFCMWFITFHFITLLWIFFRAENSTIALEFIMGIIRIDQIGEGFPILTIFAILTTMGIQIFGSTIFNAFSTFQKKLFHPVQIIIFALLAALILSLGPDGVLPFIYFQF